MNSNLIYLNTAGTGLVSNEAVEKAKHFLDKTLIDPSEAFLEWLANDLPRLRKKTAQFFDTTDEQIAFAPNFSFALSSIIQSLEGRAKKVLLYNADYPSLNLPFELGDFEVHYINSRDGFHISTEHIIEKIEKEKIEIAAFSHVQFLTGFRLDIHTIGKYCKENGIVFIVDGTQSMGATPINFERLAADVLIGSSYKWLNGGFGSAVVCFKNSFIENFPPRTAGFGSMDKSADRWFYRPSNKSFEPGHMNAPALIQLQEGINYKLKAGIDHIHTHNTVLMQQLQEELLKLPVEIIGANDFENRLHILIFKAGKSIADALQQDGFAVTWRRDTIRVSPHYYNTEEDIDAFVSALSAKIS